MDGDVFEMQVMADLDMVVHNVAEEVQHRLQEKIKLYVYEYGDPLRVYYFDKDAKPTWQFYDSINTVLEKSLPDYVSYRVFSDSFRMDFWPEKHLHSYRGQDIRDRMIEALNENTMSDFSVDDYPENDWWRKREPFFDYLLDELDATIWQIFEDEMNKIGMGARRAGSISHG